MADNLGAFASVVAGTGDCAAVVGYVDVAPSGRLLNAAALCRGGEVLGRYVKRILPNYGVFDEQRWFAPGTGRPRSSGGRGDGRHVRVRGHVVPGRSHGRGGGGRGPARGQPQRLALLRGRREERLAVLAERTAETGCAIVYVNQVGGQDELVFDGASLVVDATGAVVASARQFTEDVLVVDLESRRPGTAPAATSEPGRGLRRVPGRPGRRDPPAGGARARPGGRGLRRAGAGHPRLPVEERLRRRRHRPVGRDRLVAGGGRRRRRRRAPTRSTGWRCRRGTRAEGSVTDAEALAAQPRDRPGDRAHRAGPRRLHRHAAPLLGRRAVRTDRREPPEPDPGRAPHGGVQRHAAGSCSRPGTRARWPPGTRPSTATRRAGSR